MPLTINNPPAGSSTKAPVNFAGTPPSTLANGLMDATAQALGYQIDGNPMVQIPITTGQTKWSIPTLTNTDCPSQYTWYTLTVTECTGTGAFTIDQVTFYRGT